MTRKIKDPTNDTHEEQNPSALNEDGSELEPITDEDQSRTDPKPRRISRSRAISENVYAFMSEKRRAEIRAEVQEELQREGLRRPAGSEFDLDKNS